MNPNTKRQLITISLFLFLFNFSFGQIVINEPAKFEDYHILKETIYITSRNHIEEKTHLEIISSLIKGLNRKLGLTIEFSLTGKVLTINYKSKTFTVKGIYTSGLIDFCDFLKPEIELILRKYNLSIEYEHFLCDIMLSQINGNFYSEDYIAKVFRGSYLNHLNYYENKQGQYILKQTVYDLNRKPFIAGSIITEINSIPIRLITKSIFAKILYDNKDTTVQLKTVFKKDTLVLLFRNNFNQTLNDAFFKTYNDSILYIKLERFDYGTVKSIKEFYKTDSAYIKNIIIDIRECPGGLLSEVIKTIELFVKKGSLIAETKTRSNAKKYIAENSPFFSNQSITIVTDSLTSSGSEILAFSLKTLCKAKVVGQKTMGSGSIHQGFSMYQGKYTIDLPSTILTVADCFELNKDSIIPDISLDKDASISEILTYAGD